MRELYRNVENRKPGYRICVDLLEMIDMEQNNSEGVIAADLTRAFETQHI